LKEYGANRRFTEWSNKEEVRLCQTLLAPTKIAILRLLSQENNETARMLSAATMKEQTQSGAVMLAALQSAPKTVETPGQVPSRWGQG
jgi:hypothetical protein